MDRDPDIADVPTFPPSTTQANIFLAAEETKRDIYAGLAMSRVFSDVMQKQNN